MALLAVGFLVEATPTVFSPRLIIGSSAPARVCRQKPRPA